MENNIKYLEKRLQDILRQQEELSDEINKLKKELNDTTSSYCEDAQKETIQETFPPEEKHAVIQKSESPITSQAFSAPNNECTSKKSNWEKFIGENLINKIGIIILLIGAAIGVKYSIDNQLLSPIVRIILGYLLGIILLGFGIKLKHKYLNYSAVLVSGAIAIFYFVTFAGYNFYNLIPQIFAFLMMLLFTGFAVFVSIYYNRQIISHIGLVGAYAIPFLLSENSGNVFVLFIYMTIINLGILSIAYKKYWKPLYFSSFALTWIIFFSWYISRYESENFVTAFAFLCVVFVVFYCMFLIYKLIRKENYKKIDIVPLLVNSFLFYGIGYSIIDFQTSGTLYLGLFTFVNAIIHLAASLFIRWQKLADKKLLYFTLTLVVSFVTITIPVCLDGNWVTLLWLTEAAIFFCLGRHQRILIFEKIAYPLLFIAFFSLIHDWIANYTYTDFSPFLNIHFLTSVFAIISFSGINYFYFSSKYQRENSLKKTYIILLKFSIPSILLIVLYFSFYLEIMHYWNLLYEKMKLAEATYSFRKSIHYYEQIWLLNYSLIFASILSIVNQLKIKNRKLGFCSILISFVFLFLFLTVSLFGLSELRENALEMHEINSSNVYLLRYVSFVFAGIALFCLHRNKKQTFILPISNTINVAIEYVIHFSLIWMLSSELINWLNIAGYTQTYKLGLSILWGVYALWLVILGIWKKKKHVRIGSFILFGITLMKVCFYDLSQLNTLSKTIIFVILGIILLIVSFLYNKYKHLISNEK